jgi:hypothetical protein
MDAMKAMVFASLLLTACGPTNVQPDSFCLIYKPVFFQPGEAAKIAQTNPQTLRSIVSLNDAWQTNCKH